MTGQMATNKIVRKKLEKTVEDLIAAGISTSSAIADALKAQGHSVSQPTVSRYLRTLEEQRRDETIKLVSDHVQKNVPADLTALETMEAQCLDWAGEKQDAFAHRLAAKHIQEAAQEWSDAILQLTDADPKARAEALEVIAGQCLLWIADDLKLQSARIAAMKQAAAIIQLKLHFALGDKSEGNIYFLDAERGDRIERDDQTGRVMVFPGGKD